MGFIKGMDVSTLLEMEELGAGYYDNGIQGDMLEILKAYGMNSVRLRLWNDPYSEDGHPYGAGTNDLPRTVRLIKRAHSIGVSVLLDFQYSDFWADPGKQTMPKAWRELDYGALKKEVYEYTRNTLSVMKDEDCLPELIQTGNELSNGLLWPFGKEGNRKEIAELVSAGIRGVKSIDPDIPVMIHLDNGGNNKLYRRWFDDYFEYNGEDFEYIGLSYYPFWHGTLEGLSANMADISLRYKKDLIVAEVSMGFTMEDYRSYERRGRDPGTELIGMATRPELVEKIEYPMTKEGQAGFMKDIMTRISEVPGGRGKGFYYWEPGWLPIPGSGWANEYALEYTKEKGPGGNEWANQALFDYDGNALPALETIRDFSGVQIKNNIKAKEGER